MTLDDLIRIAEDYEDDVLYSPFNTHVHFGCECGCGGDLYTRATWDEACRAYDNAEQAWVSTCNMLGIYDPTLQDELCQLVLQYACLLSEIEEDILIPALGDYLGIRRKLMIALGQEE